MLDHLKGKRALVTGASGGVGASISERLAAEGMHLVLSARDVTRLEGVASSCAAAGAEVQLLGVDLGEPEGPAQLLADAGPIDSLVNNAGVEVTLGLLEQTSEDVRRQVDTNLWAPIELTRLALPGLIERGSGAVVNISSMSGKAATPYNSVYAATKHGLVGLSSSLDAELQGTGVHVGVVCPSFVSNAGMWAKLGLRAPLAMGAVSLEAVADAVVQVLRGAPEVLVTRGPIRPLLALREIFPRLEGPALRASGITHGLLERARVAGERRRRGQG
ncbi:MAG: SDR family NAD(P)-dependent oxidoreductase [Deltaproteobacteria bacterium]|jgi:short-subunit dehydrogenase|nr:SDR family NAD(P)-dependent oxidoreductase [Deltaproteobacteria bacterium]MBW2537288.1 SDR family NAD(P)-dependent oxidoreductase [Deltaproteobacteria bacterium]